MCVTMGEEDIRMFVHNPGVKGSILHVEAFVNNPLTGLTLKSRGCEQRLDADRMGPTPPE